MVTLERVDPVLQEGRTDLDLLVLPFALHDLWPSCLDRLPRLSLLDSKFLQGLLIKVTETESDKFRRNPA